MGPLVDADRLELMVLGPMAGSDVSPPPHPSALASPQPSPDDKPPGKSTTTYVHELVLLSAANDGDTHPEGIVN
ncbi:unnamed protein product [Cutaneotrichosporon oleaginosum]